MKKVFKQDGERQVVIFDDLTEMSFADYKKQGEVKENKKQSKKESVSLEDASDLLNLKD